MNKSLRGFRIKKFPNLANFIQAMKSLAVDLANVNGHRYRRVKSGTQVSNNVERLDGRITDDDGINCNF